MRIRKAILTGGGRATRLHPITTTTNKHLLPLANKPMIFHAIEKVVDAGVKEIFINTNPGEKDLQDYIGDGGHWGVDITFFEQTGGPQGIAHVVNEAQRFIGSEPFMFYLSDNILLGSINEMLSLFNSGGYDCMLALSKVKDPQRFGVPVFNDGVLVDVVEKPQNPPNDFAVTGIYLYGSNVFFEAFKQIEKSARGEYEISSIHSHFIKNGLKVGYKEITGWWKDTGKSEDLLVANKLLLDQMAQNRFSNNGVVDMGAQISGNVQIGRGSSLNAGAKIVGPVIVGQNCNLRNCAIGPYVTIGSGSDISEAAIKSSIILENCLINHPITISDSIIGKNTKLIKKIDRAAEGHSMIIGDKTIIEF